MPRYIFAVLKNYCDLKLARGKTSREIEQKLTVLEHEVSRGAGRDVLTVDAMAVTDVRARV